MPIYEPDSVSYSDDDSSGYDRTAADPSVLEPSGSAYSTQSIHAKQTGATLAETFSSGHNNDEATGAYFPNSHGLEFADSESEDYGRFDVNKIYNNQGNAADDDGNDTIDYLANPKFYQGEEETQYTNEQPGFNNGAYQDDKTRSTAHSGDFAHHMRGERAAGWEMGTPAYDEESKTLNTNLEGVEFLPPSVVHDEHGHTHMHHPGYMEDPAYNANNNMHHHPAYGMHDAAYMQHHQHPYMHHDPAYHESSMNHHPSDEQYDNDGGYYEDAYFDPNGGHRNHSYSQHQVVTEHTAHMRNIRTSLSKKASSRAMEDEYSADSDDNSQLVDSYLSEESASSWEESSSKRDISLLDSADSQDFEATFDESEDRNRKRAQRRRKSRTPNVLTLLTSMRHCNLKGASASYESNDDYEFLPDVAQISNNVSSKSSMTEDSYEQESRRSKKKSKKRRSRKHATSGAEALFNKVAVLSGELMGTTPKQQRKKKGSGSRGGKSRRRSDSTDEEDQAARLIESFGTLFSCGGGAPRRY